ncbi:unnamed protein product [Caenorhabditis bovis]|uniref:Uncharacterized protein n=1 Tax=Caenorhabditis bovis TaxID=2654633 RepID=A0A8S1EEP4_9PELO|nr:unnamed protein product [Caenorhabditis bovis]
MNVGRCDKHSSYWPAFRVIDAILFLTPRNVRENFPFNQYSDELYETSQINKIIEQLENRNNEFARDVPTYTKAVHSTIDYELLSQLIGDWSLFDFWKRVQLYRQGTNTYISNRDLIRLLYMNIISEMNELSKWGMCKYLQDRVRHYATGKIFELLPLDEEMLHNHVYDLSLAELESVLSASQQFITSEPEKALGLLGSLLDAPDSDVSKENLYRVWNPGDLGNFQTEYENALGVRKMFDNTITGVHDKRLEFFCTKSMYEKMAIRFIKIDGHIYFFAADVNRIIDTVTSIKKKKKSNSNSTNVQKLDIGEGGIYRLINCEKFAKLDKHHNFGRIHIDFIEDKEKRVSFKYLPYISPVYTTCLPSTLAIQTIYDFLAETLRQFTIPTVALMGEMRFFVQRITSFFLEDKDIYCVDMRSITSQMDRFYETMSNDEKENVTTDPEIAEDSFSTFLDTAFPKLNRILHSHGYCHVKKYCLLSKISEDDRNGLTVCEDPKSPRSVSDAQKSFESSLKPIVTVVYGQSECIFKEHNL